jgi:hypothetical protein
LIAINEAGGLKRGCIKKVHYITICKFSNKLKASKHVNKVVELFYEILV